MELDAALQECGGTKESVDHQVCIFLPSVLLGMSGPYRSFHLYHHTLSGLAEMTNSTKGQMK